MKCGTAYKELAAYTRNELPAERQQELGRHVGECQTCRQRLAALRAVDGALRALPREEPPAETILAARRLLSAEIRPPPESEVLTLDEVAAFLRIEPEELGPYVEQLPAFELGGRIRVRRSRLLEWIEQRERQFGSGGAAGPALRFWPVEPWKGVAL
jgi:hypothetical protein